MACPYIYLTIILSSEWITKALIRQLSQGLLWRRPIMMTNKLFYTENLPFLFFYKGNINFPIYCRIHQIITSYLTSIHLGKTLSLALDSQVIFYIIHLMGIIDEQFILTVNEFIPVTDIWRFKTKKNDSTIYTLIWTYTHLEKTQVYCIWTKICIVCSPAKSEKCLLMALLTVAWKPKHITDIVFSILPITYPWYVFLDRTSSERLMFAVHWTILMGMSLKL